MTSNVGARKLTEKKLSFGFVEDTTDKQTDVKESVIGELKNTFRPEFINRVDDIIVFSKLNRDEIGEIAEKMLLNLAKRLENLEAIADSFEGVEKSFAIQAGREVRIIVKPEKISDDKMTLLARDVSKRIEDEMDYPGQIKVNIIRETRVVEYAK